MCIRRVLLVSIALIGVAWAQNVAADQSDVNRALLQRIEELEKRVRELETKNQPNVVVGEARDANRTPAPQPETPVPTANIAPEGVSLTHGIQLHGYGHLNFQAIDSRVQKGQFAIGGLDLLMTSRISDRLSALSEVFIGPTPSGEFGIDLERLILQYSQSERLNLAFGRYYTGIGYYNSAYNHGIVFQTATDRPLMFQFSDFGGIVPTQAIGVSAHGRLWAGLHYLAEVGNADTVRPSLSDPLGGGIRENNGILVNAGLLLRPDSLPGFEAGASVYHDHLAPDGLPRLDQFIPAIHVIYQKPGFEFLNEAILVRHRVRGSDVVYNTPAFYTQISRRFASYRPYFRYQYVNAPAADLLLGDVGRQNGPSFGLRYDFGELAAFKIQYDRLRQALGKTPNAATVQMSFAF